MRQFTARNGDFRASAVVMRRLQATAVAAFGALLLTAIAPGASAADEAPAPGIRATIEASLDPETNRPAARLPRVTIADDDLTVVFAMRDVADDPVQIGARGRADALQILRAVYSSPDASAGAVARVIVIGTYAVYGNYGTTREIPLLRVGLDGSHVDRLSALTAYDLTAADYWWQHPALAPRPPAAGMQTVRRDLDVALIHLNATLFALSGNDVAVARSQFKQFFDAWEDLDDLIRLGYPERYVELDGAVNRVELALLRHQPENVEEARASLTAARANLLGIAHEIEGTE